MLTTNSLEECEAICTRLGILVKGELRCLGSAQYLKSKSRKGYLLQIRQNPPNPARSMTQLDPEIVTQQINGFINRNFPNVAFL